MSSTARSVDWIAIEYINQRAPSTFSTLGAEDSPAVAEGSFSISVSLWFAKNSVGIGFNAN